MLNPGRHSLAGALVLLLSAGHAAADEQDTATANCEDEPTAEARVTCLEQQSRQRSGARDNIPETEGLPNPGGVTQDEPDGDVPTAEPKAPIAPPSLGPGPAAQPEIAAPGDSGDSGGIAASGAAPADFEPGERYPAKVTAFEFVARDRLRVELANGQVWRQTDSERATLEPKLDTAERFDVELWQSQSGDYRMHIPLADRTIPVERVE